MLRQGKIKGESKKSGWDKAIADAQRKIGSLREAIAVFKARKKAGETWPGDEGVFVQKT